jgi:hypothetical protein
MKLFFPSIGLNSRKNSFLSKIICAYFTKDKIKLIDNYDHKALVKGTLETFM